MGDDSSGDDGFRDFLANWFAENRNDDLPMDSACFGDEDDLDRKCAPAVDQPRKVDDTFQISENPEFSPTTRNLASVSISDSSSLSPSQAMGDDSHSSTSQGLASIAGGEGQAAARLEQTRASPAPAPTVSQEKVVILGKGFNTLPGNQLFFRLLMGRHDDYFNPSNPKGRKQEIRKELRTELETSGYRFCHFKEGKQRPLDKMERDQVLGGHIPPCLEQRDYSEGNGKWLDDKISYAILNTKKTDSSDLNLTNRSGSSTTRRAASRVREQRRPDTRKRPADAAFPLRHKPVVRGGPTHAVRATTIVQWHLEIMEETWKVYKGPENENIEQAYQSGKAYIDLSDPAYFINFTRVERDNGFYECKRYNKESLEWHIVRRVESNRHGSEGSTLQVPDAAPTKHPHGSGQGTGSEGSTLQVPDAAPTKHPHGSGQGTGTTTGGRATNSAAGTDLVSRISDATSFDGANQCDAINPITQPLSNAASPEFFLRLATTAEVDEFIRRSFEEIAPAHEMRRERLRISTGLGSPIHECPGEHDRHLSHGTGREDWEMLTDHDDETQLGEPSMCVVEMPPASLDVSLQGRDAQQADFKKSASQVDRTSKTASSTSFTSPTRELVRDNYGNDVDTIQIASGVIVKQDTESLTSDLAPCVQSPQILVVPRKAGRGPELRRVEVARMENPAQAYQLIGGYLPRPICRKGIPWGHLFLGYILPRRDSDGLYEEPTEAAVRRVMIKRLFKPVVDDLSRSSRENPYSEIMRMKQLAGAGREEGLVEDSYTNDYVLGCIDVMASDEFLYVITPYCEGGTLLQHIGSISTTDRSIEALGREFYRQMTERIQYLHETHGLCHRDIDPEKFLVRGDGQILLDGFAMSSGIPPSGLINHVGESGNPSYCPPEALQKHAFCARQCDLWACTVILWNLVTGLDFYQWPDHSDPIFRYAILGRHLNPQHAKSFAKRTLEEKINVSEPWENLLHQVPTLSPQLLELFHNVFTVDPNDRWTMEQVLECEWMTMEP